MVGLLVFVGVYIPGRKCDRDGLAWSKVDEPGIISFGGIASVDLQGCLAFTFTFGGSVLRNCY
jgi:hypothetical protein